MPTTPDPATPAGWAKVNTVIPTYSAEFSLPGKGVGSGKATYAFDVSVEGVRRIYTVDPILRTREYVMSVNSDGIVFNKDDQVYNNLVNLPGSASITTLIEKSRLAASTLLPKVVTTAQKQQLQKTKDYKTTFAQVPQSSPGTPGVPGTPPPGAPAPAPEVDVVSLTTIVPNVESNNALDRIKGLNLTYPLNAKLEDNDMLKIKIYDYVKSGFGDEEGSLEFNIKSMTKRLEGTEPKSTIYLPAQNSSGISDSLTVGWGSGDLNPVTAQFARLAYETIGKGDDPISAGAGFVKGVGDIADKFKNASGELRQMLVNYFTEQAVQTTGLLSRTAEAAINNNVELLFSGVQLRDFTLTYRLTPREKNEAVLIRDIIRAFKISMTPARSKSGLFLLAPCVYQLSYLSSNSDHPYLNKFKACALKGFNVNYTPDGTYMTYGENKSMTQYEIQFSFGEIDPIYREDYDDSGNTMGY